MNRTLFSLGLALLAAGPVYAQTPPRNEPPPAQERRDDRRDRRDDRRDARDERQQDRRDTRDDRRDARDDRRDDRRADARSLSGEVVRLADDQFVVRTRDGREVTVYTGKSTRYLRDDRPVRYADVRIGSEVRFGYLRDGDRYVAEDVTLLPARPARPPDAPVDEGTTVEGQIVRIVGKDQVVIRTSDGKEVIVNVGPQTVYQLNTPQPATITDLRAGTPIGVQYEMRDSRPTARRFFAPRRNR